MAVDWVGEVLRRCTLLAAAMALACALVWPTAAAAETFFVNTAADEADVTVGDEFCVTGAGKCSLRAALEEANFSAEGFDEIQFEEEPFDGSSAGGTIELGSALPAITSPLGLRGRECENQSGVLGPCVGIDGLAAAAGLAVEETSEVEIENLAITGAEVGIAVSETPKLRLRGSWFGVGIDGVAAGNGVGIELGPGADGSRIGGEGPGTGNFVADSTGIGLDILGAGNANVLGNRFGVTPAGTPAANGTDIAVASTAGSDANDNKIGTRVSPEAIATAQCDGGCNLVSGSGSSGIDLAGDGGERLPALGTTIAGNQIGLDLAGEASLPNAGPGVLVGTASRTVVGGSRAGDANSFAGGTAAVEAGPAVPYLVVRGNLIGSSAGPGGEADPPGAGILVNAEGLLLPAEEAQILENEIGLDGGTGIAQKGLGAAISANLIEGAATGIEVQEEGSENLIESNLVAATDVGLLVKGSFNTIVGNEISGGKKAGIRIEGSGLFGVSGNVIGGDTAAAENTIGGSGGAAIEIANAELSLTEVARNHGGGNAGPFIDLVTVGGEPEGPNEGILPPTIAAATQNGASGFADPNTVVRVFRKQTASPGEIESFLGETTTDKDGNWTLSFPTALPLGTNLAATQTNAFGGTSELGFAEISNPVSGGGEPGPPPGPSVDKKPPRTQILLQPKRVSENRDPKFAFTSNEPRSRFQCSLDGAKFKGCKSPKRYRNLKPGKHAFRVRAIDRAGNVDPTPLKRRFEILG